MIELLLYIGIAAVVLLAISIFISVLLQGRVKNQTISEVEQQGIQAMQIITQTIRNASGVTAPTMGLSGVSLTLTIPIGSSGPKTPTIFDLSSGVLRIKEGAAATVDLTNNRVIVSNLNFQNLTNVASSNVIRVSFTITYINSSGKNEYNYSKNFYDSATQR